MQLNKLALFWAAYKYKLLAGIAILAALAVAIYAAHTVGYNKGKNISEVVITRYEGEIKKLIAERAVYQAKVDTKIVKEYITKTVYLDKIVTQNRDIIRTKIIDRPVNLTVTKGWIYAHNQSALGLPIDPVKAADPAISGIVDSKILDRVAENYGIGQNNANRLTSLQSWVKETADAAKKANNAK